MFTFRTPLAENDIASRSARGSQRFALNMVALAAFAGALILSGCQQREVLTVEASRKMAQDSVTNNAQNLVMKVRVFFVQTTDGKLDVVPVERAIHGTDVLGETVQELLKGPTEQEAANGIASEIPKGTTLLDAKESAEGIELNLSAPFAADGGTDSLETRLDQLSKTVSAAVHDKKVFLDIDGKRLTETSGEGIEVRQPINL
jgi:spore germination protein GerM